VTELFTKLNAELDINNPKSRIRELSYDCIFGTDANPRMSKNSQNEYDYARGWAWWSTS